MEDWHYRLRGQPPVILIRIIELLAKNFFCTEAIIEILDDIDQTGNSRFIETEEI